VAIGVFLCAVAAGFVLVAYRRVPEPALTSGPVDPPMTADARRRVAVTAAGLLGFCFLLPWVGYALAAFGFVALLLRRLGGGGWPGVLAVGAVSAGLSYYVFAVVLGVPLPRGVLLP
jgi:hypothetical protein